MKLKRTHMCGEVSEKNLNETVVVCGWVHNWRDHGGVIFIDVRDRTGKVQIVFSPDNENSYEIGKTFRSEYVVAVEGVVIARPDDAVNEDIATGKIEVHVGAAEVLNASKTTPFEIKDYVDVSEDLRLKYRYLDLRRPELQKVLLLRHRLAQLTRRFFTDNGFVEIETPFLTRSTPEGARDFLVPSRIHEGSFYALPQSPQTYKQITMVAGFDRYFQIVKCFRDEDLRRDRQPEFTQIDVEMSFVDEEDVLGLVEEFMILLFKEIHGIDLDSGFPRMTYKESMDRFGTDKPDLRFGLELNELGDIFADTEFQVFRKVLDSDGYIGALAIPGGASFSRKQIDGLTDWVKTMGANGLAHLKYVEGAFQGGISKFVQKSEAAKLVEQLGLEDNALVLIVADARVEFAKGILGFLRNRLADELNLIPEDKHSLHWTVEFPLLEYSEEEERYVARHHPFTSPQESDMEILESDPGAARARAYDLIYNGNELAGGSIRIHQRALQEQVFKALRLTDEEAESKFGFLMEAFEYGAPPHGGIAFGFDRMVMLMAGVTSIRDVIAFPKTASAVGLMENTPAGVADTQLKELHINVRE